MKTEKRGRRDLLFAAALGVAPAAAAAPAAATTGAGKVKSPGGYRLGNIYFSSGLTGAGADIDAQTHDIMNKHKANLESMGSSLDNVLKVTAFLADVAKEKPAFNKAYATYFTKDAPARTALGGIFPDDKTRVEIEVVAYVP
ncbi:MAG: RidA family protein [Acidobacteria bacterium]|nr:RidA family protein [Acidobacteriota bacterium]